MENWKLQPQEVKEWFDELLQDLSRTYKFLNGCFKAIKKLFRHAKRKKLHQDLESLITQNAHSETINICDQILEIKPKDFNALLQKGIALCRIDIYKEGIETLGEAAKINSRSAIVFLEMGKAYSDMGNPWMAIERYKRALLNSSDSITRAEILALRGDEYMRLQLYWEARKDYQLAANAQRKDYAVVNKLGQCLYSLGLYKNALETSEASLNIKADYEPAIHNKLISLMALGKTTEALEVCNQQLIVEPGSSEYLLIKSDLFCLLHRYKDADSICDTVLSINSETVNEHEHETGKNLKLESHYRAKALLCKGNALAGQGLYNKATEVYKLSIQNGDINCQYRALVANGQALECQERFGEALQAYHHALTIDHRSSLVMFRYYRVVEIIELYSACISMKLNPLVSLSLGPLNLSIG